MRFVVWFLIMCCLLLSMGQAMAQDATQDVPGVQGEDSPAAQDLSLQPAPTGAPLQLDSQPDPAVQAMDDILDIKPVRDPGLGIDWMLLAVVFGLGLLLAILAWLLARWLKRERQAEPEPEAHEQALAALRELEAQALDSRLHYFELSDIVRRYVERRFDRPVMEMTSEEFLELLPDIPLDMQLREGMVRLVRRWDRCKYAGQKVSRDCHREDMLLVHAVVEQTRAREEDEETGEQEERGAAS